MGFLEPQALSETSCARYVAPGNEPHSLLFAWGCAIYPNITQSQKPFFFFFFHAHVEWKLCILVAGISMGTYMAGVTNRSSQGLLIPLNFGAYPEEQKVPLSTSQCLLIPGPSLMDSFLKPSPVFQAPRWPGEGTSLLMVFSRAVLPAANSHGIFKLSII